MARFTFVAAALAVAGAQWARRDWNSACANPQCTRQGKVTGPQDVNAAVWTQAQTALNIIAEYGIVVEGGGARIALAQEASCPAGGLCAATAVYNASGVPIYERVYDDVPLYTATYTFGVPAVAAYSSTGETVIVTGQGYHLDNGTYVSVLFGVAPLSGAVLWNTTTFGSLTGDVMPSGVGLHLYAVQGTSLLRISATNGSIEWSVALPGADADPPSALARRVVLATDDSVAAVLDAGNGVVTGIDTTRANGLIMWQSNATTLPLSNCAHPAFDGGTGSLFIANGSSLVAFDLETGDLLFTVPYPDAVSTLRPGMAVDAWGRHVFVYASQSVPGAPYQSGAPLLYAFDKTTGSIVGRYVFNGSTWAQWGSTLIVDATGTLVYTALLGPHLDAQAAPATAPVGSRAGAKDADAAAERRLQQGGSVYITAATFDAATGAFVSSIAPAPTALQAGFPTFAMGPAPGQITIASSNAVAVLAA